MQLTLRGGKKKSASVDDRGGELPSPGLQWFWQQLRDVPRPLLLDCGTARPSTVSTLLKRGAKLYIADLMRPLERSNPRFWQRKDKVSIFLTEDFLALLPPIAAGSLVGVFCWHLLDLVPSQAVPVITRKLYGLLQPGGVLFCLLRQPYMRAGADASCWLQGLTTIVTDGKNEKPFPYPVITNREMERLFPPGSVKVFLTRSGRREVVALR